MTCGPSCGAERRHRCIQPGAELPCRAVGEAQVDCNETLFSARALAALSAGKLKPHPSDGETVTPVPR